MRRRLVHTNCRHYRGDRPCQPHKERGVVCDDCSFYDPIKYRVLIIKLGAAGDVLRTTALLPALREHCSSAHITWVCRESSFELIQHNPFIDRPLAFNAENRLLLSQEHFDLVVNLDLDPLAAALASSTQSKTYRGYGRDRDGSLFAFTPEAEEWLQMSLWDDYKNANRRTYQSHILQITGLPDETKHPIYTPLLSKYRLEALHFAEKHGLNHGERPVIGLNIGAGQRWMHKKWTVEGFVELAQIAREQLNADILILYGPEDLQRALDIMQALKERRTPFIDGHPRPSMLDFFAVMNLADVVVTGDTLGLHAALGLGKRVVCLVGPTSATELELYGQGVILQGQIDCLGCYLTWCGKDLHCMKLLKAETVFQAVQGQMYHA